MITFVTVVIFGLVIAWACFRNADLATALQTAEAQRARAERDNRFASENWRDAELRHAQILRGVRRLQTKHPRLAEEIALVVFSDGLN